MSETLFSFRHSSYSRFLEESSKKTSRDSQGGLKSRLINFLKPRCLGKAIRKKARAFIEPEKQMQLLHNRCQIATLGDWLLASPGLNHHFNEARDFYSPKLSKNVETGKEFGTMNESIKLDNGYSLCKTQSGKSIKRVQFRIPEVVDVFIIDSPEELVASPHIES